MRPKLPTDTCHRGLEEYFSFSDVTWRMNWTSRHADGHPEYCVGPLCDETNQRFLGNIIAFQRTLPEWSESLEIWRKCDLHDLKNCERCLLRRCMVASFWPLLKSTYESLIVSLHFNLVEHLMWCSSTVTGRYPAKNISCNAMQISEIFLIAMRKPRQRDQYLDRRYQIKSRPEETGCTVSIVFEPIKFFFAIWPQRMYCILNIEPRETYNIV